MRRLRKVVILGLATMLLLGLVGAEIRRARTPPDSFRAFDVQVIGTKQKARLMVSGDDRVVFVRSARKDVPVFIVIDNTVLVDVDPGDVVVWARFDVDSRLSALAATAKLSTVTGLWAKECHIVKEDVHRLVEVLVERQPMGQPELAYEVCGAGVVGGVAADGRTIGVVPRLGVLGPPNRQEVARLAETVREATKDEVDAFLGALALP
jgi:hypothetical protein